MMKVMFFLLIHTTILASSQKELLSLHQKAEAAMHKENYLEAKEHYATLIQKIEEKGEWNGYIDSVLRYAEALIHLHELVEAEKCLDALLAKQPPARYYNSIKFLQARTKTGPDGLLQSYKEMSQLQKEFPFSEWPSESRLFFHTLEISANDYFENLLKKAQLFYLAYEYEQALTLYHQIEQAIAQGCYPKAKNKESLAYQKIQLAIAKTLYKLTERNKSLLVIQGKEIEDTIDCELLHLVAQVDKETRAYHKAIAQNPTKDNENHYLEALYELGMLYYKNNNWHAAKKQFENMQERGNKKNTLVLLAMTTLADIYLQEKNIPKAQELVTLINKSNPKHEALREITAYLQGQIFLEIKQYTKAIIHFNHALALSNRHKEQIALHLLHCYLYVENKIAMQKLVDYLLETKERPKALLWLAHLQLLDGHLTSAYTLLSENFTHFSEEQQLSALLFMAKAEQKHLTAATEMTYAYCMGYDYAWLCRGIAALQNRECTAAIDAFEIAFASKKHSLDPLLYYWCDKERTEIFSLLSKHEELSSLSFIVGMIYAYYDEEKAIAFFEKMEDRDGFGDKIHYMLGTLLYKKKVFSEAKEHFITLARNYPESNLAAAGWYWAAESEEQEQPSSIHITSCRNYLCEEYPESPFCAESYFKLFSIDDYIQGEAQAIEHLQQFTHLFPDSTLHVAAYYLLSMHQNDKITKLELLEKAVASFATLAPEQRSQGVRYFYIKALMKIAKLEPDQTIVLLKPLVQELASISWKEKNGISLLLEECQLMLARAYRQNKKLHKAQKLLLDILEAHAQCGIEEGYFLALAWQEQGDLALAAGEKQIALTHYELALKSGCLHLSEGEKATLYLKKTRCK